MPWLQDPLIESLQPQNILGKGVMAIQGIYGGTFGVSASQAAMPDRRSESVDRPTDMVRREKEMFCKRVPEFLRLD